MPPKANPYAQFLNSQVKLLQTPVALPESAAGRPELAAIGSKELSIALKALSTSQKDKRSAKLAPSVIKQAAAQLEVLEEENFRKRRKLERQIDRDGSVSLDLSKDNWYTDLPEEWPGDQGEDAEAYAALLQRVKAAQRKRDALQAQKAQYETIHRLTRSLHPEAVQQNMPVPGTILGNELDKCSELLDRAS